MDHADWAVDNQERAEAQAAKLRQRAQPMVESAKECIDCGDDIPQGRRAAVKGVQLCTECQEFADKRGKA